MEKKFVFSYNTLDNKVREFVWDASQAVVDPEDQFMFERLVEFCETKETCFMGNEKYSVEWGFRPCERTETHPYLFEEASYKYKKFEGLYHIHIIKPIVLTIAHECMTNRELYLEVLKDAYRFAAGKDREAVNLDLAYGYKDAAIEKAFRYRDAVNDIENVIDEDREMGETNGTPLLIAMLIEEFGLFKVLDFKPYEAN